ncbi:MAG: N-acetylmuramoyl-L-alanine amidase [Leptospiraceae bacterium]|nr:N-acetylmuramoyl-L-alanine amidase [Leptospiraceae bacterium]MDW7977009.1 N-acetylmuramoyl-L-alanine amidase [Leptospiraceae bacterium]
MRRNFLLLFFGLILGLSSEEIPIYRVVVDPGHGGVTKDVKDDRWDPITKEFLDYYNAGMSYKNYHEHRIVLVVAKKLHQYLHMTETDEGWRKFHWILKQYAEQETFPRIVIKSYLTRDKNWEDTKLPKNHPSVNEPFRLYDYPKNNQMQLGRISYINSLRPHLVVSIHMNPGGKGHKGGMFSVLAPSFQTFDYLRNMFLGKIDKKKFEQLPWAPFWLVNEKGWSKLEMAFSDTWVYFHGYRWNKKTNSPWEEKNRGFRYNMVTWIYKDSDDWIQKAIEQKNKKLPGPYSLDYRKFIPEGKYWEREKSELEYWKREKPLPEYGIPFGGDNHYASDELLRFIQYGLRMRYPELVKKNKISDIVEPYVSAYALPTLVNAICAYLEIGHLDVKRDRELVLNYSTEIARSLAVGVYSLFVGLSLKKNYKEKFKPRGKSVDFKKYIEHKDGNYFEKVFP